MARGGGVSTADEGAVSTARPPPRRVRYTVVVYPSDPGYTAVCPALGLTGRGVTADAAVAALEAIMSQEARARLARGERLPPNVRTERRRVWVRLAEDAAVPSCAT